MPNPFHYGALLLVVAGGVLWVTDLTQGTQGSIGIRVLMGGLVVNLVGVFWTLYTVDRRPH